MERVSVPFSVRPDLERSEAPLRAGDPDDFIRGLKRAEFDGPLRSDLLGERPGCEEGVSLLAKALGFGSGALRRSRLNHPHEKPPAAARPALKPSRSNAAKT